MFISVVCLYAFCLFNMYLLVIYVALGEMLCVWVRRLVPSASMLT